MKNLIVALTLLAGFGLIAPTSAEARDHRHSASRSVARSCGDCGGSVYRERVVLRRDHCGDPVFGWRLVSHRCAPRHGHFSGHSHGRGHGHDHRSHGRAGHHHGH